MSEILVRSGSELSSELPLFHRAAVIVADSLSPTSRRVYDCTFRAWCKFADEQGFSFDEVTYGHVRAFIYQAELAKSTRQNRLSHTRKVLEALSIADRERYEQHYQGVKSFLKVKVEEGDLERPDRAKRALKPHEVPRLLDVWRDDRSIQGLRNNAMIRTLVYTGLRRSELVALRWSDVDVEAGIMTVRHGKGDKECVAAVLDSTDGTKLALERLRESQLGQFRYLFASTTRGRGTKWLADVPTSDEVVALVVEKTAAAAGLGKLASHDLRRTLIMVALESGGHVRDLQEQAGHANAAAAREDPVALCLNAALRHKYCQDLPRTTILNSPRSIQMRVATWGDGQCDS